MGSGLSWESLQEEVETWRAIFGDFADGILVADQQGKVLFSNPVAERLLGVGPQDSSPAAWRSNSGFHFPDKVTPYPPDDLPLARAMRGETVTDEVVFLQNAHRPGGAWVSVSTRPLRNVAGSICGGVAVFRDITEYQQALEKTAHATMRLRRTSEPTAGPRFTDHFQHFLQFMESFAPLSRAVEQTADSVVITDKQGIIEYVNPAFEVTTGYSRDEVLGRSPAILKSGMHDAEFYKKLWNQILKGQPFRGTIINRKKTGELYWSEQTITPMKDQDGEITHFVSVLKDITDLRKRHEQEFHLGLAREVQQRFYNVAASVPGFDIAAAAYPADETGGDCLDLISLPDGCLGIVVGDVSGHGIGSALVMAETRAYVRSFLKTASDVGEILTQVNRELVEDLEGGRSVTLLLARIDPRTRSLVYASAGHVPGFLLGSSGEVAFVMEATGPPLGFFRDSEFSFSDVIPLDPGKIVLLLTDGVTESTAPDNVEFGAKRAIEYVRSHQHEPARQIAEGLYQATRAFAAHQPQRDDITLAVLKVDQESHHLENKKD
jgi:PAS domain S-box-containing protein